MRIGKTDDHEDLFEKYQNNGIARILEFAKSDDPKHRAALIVAGILILAIAAYVSGYVAVLMDVNIPGTEKFSHSPFFYIFKAFTSLNGIITIFLLLGAIAGLAFVLLRKNSELNVIKGVDSRGVNYSEAGTYGTAEWMSRKEAEEEYEIGHIDNVRGVILGQYTDKGRECICLPEDTKGNRNILILGSPGTGKSFCYVRNAVFQAIVRGESVVITDPKGELYESTSEKLRECGYDVFVFNLVNPTRSDAWDCLSEIYDPETGDISEIRVTEFVDAIMKNTTDGPEDSFWGGGESNLMKAVVMFCAWRKEVDLKNLYEQEGKSLYAKVKHLLREDEGKKILDILSSKGQNVHMNDRKAAIRLLIKLAEGEEAVESYMERIDREASPCDMSSIYHMLVTSDIKAFEEKFKAVPVSHPAGIAWSIFKNSPDGTRPNMVQGLSQRLQLFQMRDIRRITTNKDINFENLGTKKTALFCIISDKSTAMRALTSLFFTFLFKDVSDAADRYGPKNRLPVNVICDEFANLGTIPSFDVTISTVRSRKINISIILQSVMQLTKNYEEAGETIISCCDTILFLGCNDTETAEFISNLSGIASIRVLSTKDSRNTSLGNRTIFQGYQIGEGDGKRNLLNPDEVRRLPREDVIIYHNGRNILQAHRCGFIEHKFFREGLPPEAHLRDYPLASQKYSLTEGLDAFLQADVSNMRMRNTAIINNEAAQEIIAPAKKNSESKPTQQRKVIDENAFDF